MTVRKTTFFGGMILALCLSVLHAQEPAKQTYALRNGQWFNGQTFKAKTFYVVNGTLTERKPARVDETVDLKNGFVIPPFGDAHCHHFDGTYGLDELIKTYLNEGIFYAKVPGNSPDGTRAAKAKLNRPDSVDVLYANGALTGSYSHPTRVWTNEGGRLTSLRGATSDRLVVCKYKKAPRRKV